MSSQPLTLELSDAQLFVLADRVAEILRDRHGPRRPLVDASTIAAELGCSRDTVYARAAELGGVRIGDGSRPRWRFDLDRAREAWQPASSPARPRRTCRLPGLLPVHGDAT